MQKYKAKADKEILSKKLQKHAYFHKNNRKSIKKSDKCPKKRLGDSIKENKNTI